MKGRALGLGQHGDAIAVLTADGHTLTHSELADAVAGRAASWGPGRRLVLVEGGNRLDALVAHLAALEHGHVSLLVPPRDKRDSNASGRHPIAAAYDPDVECTAAGDVVHRTTSAHTLHPDLALLSSTSGSTGSPKLVRLSARNVAANAESIADSLQLGEGDRALTSLPLHYCYGLSVVHSHLLAGGALVLTEASVVDDAFWVAARRHGATSFAAVPYTFELLRSAGFDRRRPPSLRQVTQAGGRMAPDQVVEWAERGARQGWDLVVMYGQTEATARMAYLPPALARTRPDAIGVPIPGGHLRVDPIAESDDPDVGELVYSGPNVMMGYAESPADLARGAELSELRTGDLGRLRDGLFEVVGRCNRFAKLFGLRLDLTAVEAALEARGLPVEVVATEHHLHAFVTGSTSGVTDAITRLCGLPSLTIQVHHLTALPRTGNGKVDQAALDRLAILDAERLPAGDDATSLEQWVVEAASRVLGREDADSLDSFVGLGGDSLSYVELAVRLEERLGTLPQCWHTLSFGELAAHADAARRLPDPLPPASSSRPARRVPAPGRLDTTITVRALAIVAIVASHVDLVDWQGGAHLLLALAGFNFARFQLGSAHRTTRVRHGLTAVAQILLPALVWVGVVAIWPGGYDVTTTLLLNGALGPDTWDVRWQLWFLEALAWILLGSVALVAVPALHRLERRSPFGFALAVLAVAACVRFARVDVEADALERYSTGVVAFFFALGWLAARAHTPARRVLVTVLAAVLTLGFFDDLAREGVIVAGIALFTWAPRLPVPQRYASALGRVVGVLATYSLFIYLTHWQVYPPLEDAGHPWLALLASFAVGITYGVAMRPLQRRLVARLTSRPTSAPSDQQSREPRQWVSVTSRSTDADGESRHRPHREPVSTHGPPQF